MSGNCKPGNACDSTSCSWNVKGTCEYDISKDYYAHRNQLISQLTSLTTGMCRKRSHQSEVVIDEAEYIISVIRELRGDINA